MRIAGPGQVLDPTLSNYNTLLISYSPCYEVWISIPGGLDQTGTPSDYYSWMPITKIPLKNFIDGDYIGELSKPDDEVNSYGNIRVWVDIVKFPDDPVSIRRQELILRYRFYPEVVTETPVVDHFVLKYALETYYRNGKLGIYPLTKKNANEFVENDGCSSPESLILRSGVLDENNWNGYPESNLSAMPAANDFLSVDMLSSKLHKDCNYEKIKIMWEGDKDEVDSERPFLVCDLPDFSTCVVLP